jgi:hypothetical protein
MEYLLLKVYDNEKNSIITYEFDSEIELNKKINELDKIDKKLTFKIFMVQEIL